MKKLYFLIFFILIIFSSQTAFADQGVVIKNTRVNDLFLDKGTDLKILEETKNGYKVAYDRFQFLINKDVIMKTIKTVKTPTGSTVEKEVATQGYLLDNIKLKMGEEIYDLKKGTKLAIYDYKNSKYILKDSNGKKYTLPEEYVSFNQKELYTEYSYNDVIKLQQEKLIRIALRKLGTRYLWGGEGSIYGYDCSGFTQSVYKSLGFLLPRYSQHQARIGITINDINDLQVGDLIFFDDAGGDNINHVALYLGNYRIIDARMGKEKIVLNDIRKDWLFSEKYIITIKRVLDKGYLDSLATKNASE